MKTDFPPSSGNALASEPINPDTDAPDDTIWIKLRAQALHERKNEPVLARLYDSILNSKSFETALAQNLTLRLSHPSFPAEDLKSMLLGPLLADCSIGEAARADLSAVVERDPASGRLLEPFLMFKGYAAICGCHRYFGRGWRLGKKAKCQSGPRLTTVGSERACPKAMCGSRSASSISTTSSPISSADSPRQGTRRSRAPRDIAGQAPSARRSIDTRDALLIPGAARVRLEADELL